jgi:hypothetical protein
MCDYSLMGFPNRLAVSGEELVVHRFPTNSLGLVCCPSQAPAANGRRAGLRSLWPALKSWLQGPGSEIVAVCIPPGSQLLLRDTPAHLRAQLRVGSVEEVIFTQITANAYAHRDAVRFDNGCELSLQHLIVGQRVRVLSVSGELMQTAPESFESRPQTVLP